MACFISSQIWLKKKFSSQKFFLSSNSGAACQNFFWLENLISGQNFFLSSNSGAACQNIFWLENLISAKIFFWVATLEPLVKIFLDFLISSQIWLIFYFSGQTFFLSSNSGAACQNFFLVRKAKNFFWVATLEPLVKIFFGFLISSQIWLKNFFSSQKFFFE